MDFRQTYQLVYARRWMVVTMAVIAAAVILLGTTLAARTREFQAEAILQPQELNLPEMVDRSSTSGNNGSNSNPASDTMANVSDLIMILRSSNDLYLKTAALLREEENKRAVDVQRILEKNGYFAPLDADIESQARQLLGKKELLPAQFDKWQADNKKAVRSRIVSQLSHASDASGAFAEGGIGLTDAQIMDRIRDKITVDTVAGPLSTDATPQIVNQIRVAGKFEREAEANLYVNLLSVAFIDFYTNQRSSSTNARISLLKERLTEAKQRLEKARQEDVAFRRKSGVSLTTAAGTTVGQIGALETRRNDAEGDYRAAAAAVTTLESALGQAQASRTVVLPTDENPAVQRARERLATAQISFQKVNATNLGAQSDEYRSANAELKAAQAELKIAQSRPYSNTIVNQSPEDLQAKLNAARVMRDSAQQKLSVATQQLASQQATLANLPAAQARLADLSREITISEDNAKSLEVALAKQETFSIEHGRAGTINIVSQAHATLLKGGIAAQQGKLLAYGVALALLLGIALVVGMDALDDSVRTPQDVEKMTGLPLEGIIPTHLLDPVRSPRIALLEPLSPAAESYRQLRTNLMFTQADKPFQSIMLATSKPGEGATTTICNLAIALAQVGRSVILVDADLRRPKLHSIFSTQGAVGLATVLAGRDSLDAALTTTGIENLTLLPAGYIPINPSDLLSSQRMKSLHEELKKRADFVLFDSPSAIAFSDGPFLSSFVDATMLVVRFGNVSRGAEAQVRKLLDKAHANLIGVVMNAVPFELVDSARYHSHYYPTMLPPGSGSGTNGTTGTDHSPPALPPFSDRGTRDGTAAESGAEPRAGTGESASTETVEMPAYVPEPYTQAQAAANAALYGAAGVNNTAPPPKTVPWKMVAVVIVAGALLGGLVLLLGGGLTVH